MLSSPREVELSSSGIYGISVSLLPHREIFFIYILFITGNYIYVAKPHNYRVKSHKSGYSCPKLSKGGVYNLCVYILFNFSRLL